MPHRILVLEPDPMGSVAIRAALAAGGYAVTSAPDLARFRMRTEEEAYHLVLLGPGQQTPQAASLLGLTAPVAALATLPDCVIAHALPGSAALPADLPEILELLTRYMRFAPPRTVREPHGDRLLEHWASFDTGPL